MALGKTEQTRKYYLSISEGKITHSQDGRKEYYSLDTWRLSWLWTRRIALSITW